nr:alpha/beta hydrolase [Pseudoalteromonas arctica]
MPNGVIIRGQRTRPSGKPVIHFVHGTGFSGLTYWPMLSQLTDYYDLFIHDIQGHGNSDAGRCFYGWDNNALFTSLVWNSFAKDYPNVPVIGVGHSFGGVLTALMAAENPNSFHSLILLDPVIFSQKMLIGMKVFKFLRLKSPNPLAHRARKRKNGWESHCAAISYFKERGIFKNWDDSALQAHIIHSLYEQETTLLKLKCPPSIEAEVFASFPNNLWAALKKLNVPTHIIHGQQSYPFIKHSTSRLQKLNRLVSSQIVSGGHCFMQENPLGIAQIILTRLTDSFPKVIK